MLTLIFVAAYVPVRRDGHDRGKALGITFAVLALWCVAVIGGGAIVGSVGRSVFAMLPMAEGHAVLVFACAVSLLQGVAAAVIQRMIFVRFRIAAPARYSFEGMIGGFALIAAAFVAANLWALDLALVAGAFAAGLPSARFIPADPAVPGGLDTFFDQSYGGESSD